MGERTSHAPGTFSWVDLTTTDQDAAKAFYSGLFGWEADDRPVGDDGTVYSMMLLGGRTVAAISPQPAAMKGAPPTWNSYVTVQDVDEVAGRVAQLGGTLMAPPFDVMTAGRMAVVQDPEGAMIALWQPRDTIGAELVTAPGALCWNELQSRDLDAAQRFYAALFGWDIAPFEDSPEPYLAIENAGRANGGIRPHGPDPSPAAWLVYFAVQDTDGSAAKAAELGGTVIVEPFDIPMGARIAVIGDPQGGVFALYQGPLDA